MAYAQHIVLLYLLCVAAWPYGIFLQEASLCNPWHSKGSHSSTISWQNAISAKRQANGTAYGSIDFCAAIRTGSNTERKPLPHLWSIYPNPSLPISSAWRSGTCNCSLLFAMSARLKKRSVSQLAQKKIQPARMHTLFRPHPCLGTIQ